MGRCYSVYNGNRGKYNEFTVKKNNLKSWQPGVSGNPKGRPKGSRNIKKVIQDLLNDRDLVAKLALRIPRSTETPLEAIIYTLVVKAIKGDVRASEVLLKHSIDKDMLPAEGGFFSQNELKITVVGANGKPDPKAGPAIDEATGLLRLKLLSADVLADSSRSFVCARVEAD